MNECLEKQKKHEIGWDLSNVHSDRNLARISEKQEYFAMDARDILSSLLFLQPKLRWAVITVKIIN